jgi:hypothetical protein
VTDVTIRSLHAVNALDMTLHIDTHVEQRHEAFALIESFGTIEPDGLISTRVVVDALLDIRALVDDVDLLVIDALLRSIPGVNVVESNWWQHQLDALHDLFDAAGCEAAR